MIFHPFMYGWITVPHFNQMIEKLMTSFCPNDTNILTTYENSTCKHTNRSENVYTVQFISISITYNVALVHTTVVTYCYTNKINDNIVYLLDSFLELNFSSIKKEYTTTTTTK